MSLDFAIDCHQNEYLRPGGDELRAVFQVSARGPGAEVRGGGSLGSEVLIIDVSASMDGDKLLEAKAATNAALSCITEGVRFAVIAGNEQAVQVFPSVGLVPAMPRTRRQAARAIGKLRAAGGTAIGEWVSLAARLHAFTDGVRHSILLTDGHDEHETPEALDAALALARGTFQCDCRGVGTDWSVAELRRIAAALLGEIDIVADPGALTSDFEQMMTTAMRRAVPDVRLRVTMGERCELVSLKQVAPSLVDLMPGRIPFGDFAAEFPLGAWADEWRDYEAVIHLDPGQLGERKKAADIQIVTTAAPGPTSTVEAMWTDDTALWRGQSQAVSYYATQQDLADAIQTGLNSLRNGDPKAAAVTLGTAVRLATAAGNRDAAELLEKIVDVEDGATGKVRLKDRISRIDQMTLETRSTRTVRVQK